MKLAVLSDIHGNYIAFGSCLEHALDKGADTFVFLGDYVGELPYPQKTMAMLYELQSQYPCYFIRGNKEDYWLNYQAHGATGWKDHDSTTGMLYYAYHQLTQRDLNFFRNLPMTREITFEGLPPLTVCHGSPLQINHNIFPQDEQSLHIMELLESPLTLCGHTHIQAEIIHKGKTVWNPGAVGVPWKSGGKPQFLLLHGVHGAWEPEWITLDYDVDRVLQDMQEAGLYEAAPGWSRVTRKLLQNGEITHAMVLTHAMELCRQYTGTCEWPAVPEECWQQAIQDMLGEV